MSVRGGELRDLALAGDNLGRLLEDLADTVEPDTLGALVEQLLLERRRESEARCELEGELCRLGSRDVDVAPGQLDETSEEDERVLHDRGSRRIGKILVRLHECRAEAPTQGFLDDPEALAALD